MWKVVAKITNRITEQTRNLTNQTARWYEVFGMCIKDSSFKPAKKKASEEKTFLKEKNQKILLEQVVGLKSKNSQILTQCSRIQYSAQLSGKNLYTFCS